ncbi:hypothetical protein B0H13DRAFT_2329968 [Mycena leptocephala]|nr:hypothetical protein B0H13DRAFT_2329968 [Mycena leptocephala]
MVSRTSPGADMESDGTTTGVGEQDSRGKLSPVLGYHSPQLHAGDVAQSSLWRIMRKYRRWIMNGTAFEVGSVTSGSISCTYPDAICTYFVPDGSLSSGSGRVHPNLYRFQPTTAPTTPPKKPPPNEDYKYRQYNVICEYHRGSFFTNSSNLTGECSGFYICYSNVSMKRIPPRVIAAICVAVASVVVGLTIALLLCAKHRRHTAKHGATAVDRDANTVSPFTLVTEMDGRNTSPRDSDIRSMADLQDLERSSTTADSGTRRMSGLISMRSSSTRGVPDVEAQLEASREQINMLVTRMQALEATTNSAYGAGISNEPPPAYV